MKHIRILSPSGAIAPRFILDTQKRLEEWGYRVSIGKHAMEEYGRFAGTIEQRLADLNEALADTDIDIILCSRGGYGLQQIIDKIALPQRPIDEWPLIVGYSDITELHSLMALHGVASLHMGMCRELTTYNLPLTFNHGAIQLDTKGRNGTVTGKVIGGNLSVLYGLQGTTWDLNHIIDTMDSAPILLLEDIDEAHYHIDRMMNNLRLSGVLARISGLVVGYFTNCDEDKRMCCTIADTILQAVREYNYPVMLGAPIGHEQPNRPVMLGVEHTLIVNDEGATLTPCV